MATANRNYQAGTSSGIGESRSIELSRNEELRAAHGDSLLSYYMDKFYHEARGHLVNKYHAGLWGPYVSEALRLMDRNAYADRYAISSVKTFKNTTDAHWKAAFNNWADLFYSKETHVLNMYWAASSIQIGAASATVDGNGTGGLDTTKGMLYPLIKGDAGPQTMTITVVDDPYMMWWQFFNALYNVQFSPLVLKARSTWHKINIAVDLYSEATNIGWSSTGALATEKKPYVTDISLNQMFEFNSCILTKAPDMKVGYTEGNNFTFTLSFKYPNAFQGTFKDRLRYLRDNTKDCSDGNALTKNQRSFRKAFFEDNYSNLQQTVTQRTYEAFNDTEYYKSYGRRYFATKDE